MTKKDDTLPGSTGPKSSDEGAPVEAHRVCRCGYMMIPKTLLVQHVCTKCGRFEVDDRRTLALAPDDDLDVLTRAIVKALEKDEDRYGTIFSTLSAHAISRTIWKTLRPKP